MNKVGKIFGCFLTAILCTCTTPQTNFHITGETMGTFYSVKYSDTLSRNFKLSIDSLLYVINMSMSTYIDSSLISKFNSRNDTTWFRVDEHFFKVTSISKIVYEKTNGAFDPTVMPLVNEWGFGPEKREAPDSADIEKIIPNVGFSKMQMQIKTGDTVGYFVKSDSPSTTLDYSAVAKGYGVDVIGELFEKNEVKNFMIEIGGEVRANGKNFKKKAWSIGIEKPVESEERSLTLQIFLNDHSLATSGNYRNFYVKDGKKFVHTINPKTGFPEINNTLSVSVISATCAVADAYATAFMVLGVDEGFSLAEKLEEIEVLFIFSDDEGKIQTRETAGWNQLTGSR